LAALILGSAGATATAASGGGSAASTTVAGHIDLAQLAPASQSVGWGSFLTDKTWYQDGFVIGGKKYDSGVFAHAPSNLVYDLNEQYNIFSGCVGLDDGHKTGQGFTNYKGYCGDGVDYSVIVDGKKVWSTTQKSLQPATCFAVSVKDAKQMELKADMKENADCDESAWVNAHLYEDPAVDCYRLTDLVPDFQSVGWASYWSNTNWFMNGFLVGGVRYAHGVFATANSQLIYHLDGRYDYFHTCAGVDDANSGCTTSVDFQVHTSDGEKQTKHWGALQQFGEAPSCTTLDISGQKDLILYTLSEDPTRLSTVTTCDQADWLEAKICTTKKNMTTPCTVSAFSAWGDCTHSCGTGVQHQTRTIDQHPINGGTPCPILQQTQTCNTETCAIDCDVSTWSTPTKCSKSCGGGSHEEFRTVLRPAAFGGKPCPALSQTGDCSLHNCPSDCVVSGWAAWAVCDKTCGEGQFTRTRDIVTYPTQGRICPALAQTKSCNNGPCNDDCTVTTWTPQSFTDVPCSRSCGTGYKHRARTVVHNPVKDGARCPHLTETEECNTHQCPLDCEVSHHEPWTACTKTCGGTGTQHRYRSILVENAHGGTLCPTLDQSRACMPHACPIDCVMNDFDEWTACSKSCGKGKQTRARTVNSRQEYNGQQCAHLREARDCNLHECPVDCAISTWTMWTTCSFTCGGGSSDRDRTFTATVAFGGKPCVETAADLREIKYCNQQACPADCTMGDWGQYGSCSRSCNGGSMSRTRSVATVAAAGGAECLATKMYSACNTHWCQTACEVTEWGGWSSCSKECEGGRQTRVRVTIVAPAHGGMGCPNLVQSRICNLRPCAADCATTKWSEWGTCSVSCGTGGLELRSRSVLAPAVLTGTPCGSLSEARDCGTACPEDCEMSEWGSWLPCTQGCTSDGVVGTQIKERGIKVFAQYGGKTCKSDTLTRDCNDHPCPVNCQMSDTEEWDACTRSCGKGISIRSHAISRHPAHGGTACPAHTDVRECNTQDCPVDCKMSDWSAYSVCSKSCGEGFQSRTRHVISEAANGGEECAESITSVRFCAKQGCPTDCVQTSWSEPSACSKTCGGGLQGRRRSVSVYAQHGGLECGAYTRTDECNKQACAEDCSVSYWSDWSVCSKSCGTQGVTNRFRAVNSEAKLGGAACPHMKESQKCVVSAECPVHCTVSEFGQFSTCSKTCGGGKRTRSRTILQHAEGGGYTCPSLEQVEDCSALSCPVHCQVGAWSSWSSCSKSCGTGQSKKMRRVGVDAGWGGAECPALIEFKQCNTYHCHQLCLVNPELCEAKPTPAPVVNDEDATPWAWIGQQGVKKVAVQKDLNAAVIARSAAPTKAPTKAPTVAPPATCMNGPDEVAGGWHGAGHGDNYCNLCKCDFGQLKCQQHVCGAHDADATCSHVTCKLAYSWIAEHKIMIVSHKNAEHKGSEHSCRHNYATDSCSCSCFGAPNAIWHESRDTTVSDTDGTQIKEATSAAV